MPVTALLTLSQHVLQDRRLNGRQLPEARVTAVKGVKTAPASTRACGYTASFTNDLRTG